MVAVVSDNSDKNGSNGGNGGKANCGGHSGSDSINNTKR